MLRAMDRVVMASADAAATAAGWEALLDAAPAGEQDCQALAARSHLWRLGDGWLEVLEPTGPGPVADAVQARGAHLFAAGYASEQLDALAAQWQQQGVAAVADGDRWWLDSAALGIPGLRLVIGSYAPQPTVGLIDTFYESSPLVPDFGAATDRAASVLGLDAGSFEPIGSADYGYQGVLTLFDRARLDRLEIITPNQPGTTMDRYYRKFGDSLYMCFAESPQLAEIERRAQQLGAGHTAVPRPESRDALGAHTVFLHPPALGGMMLGLSRPTWAWTWSGHPERAERSQ